MSFALFILALCAVVFASLCIREFRATKPKPSDLSEEDRFWFIFWSRDK